MSINYDGQNGDYKFYIHENHYAYLYIQYNHRNDIVHIQLLRFHLSRNVKLGSQ